MLFAFHFDNVKSFRGGVALDLDVGNDSPDFPEHPAAKAGDETILPVAAIFGPNGSGKSNVYYAFKYMCNYVAKSIMFGDDQEEFRRQRVKPFLFDSETSAAESRFEVYFGAPFVRQKRVFNYGFGIDREGVTEEWLNMTTSQKKYMNIFYRSREDNELDVPELPDNAIDFRRALKKEMLLISLGAKMNIAILKAVHDWFLANRFADCNALAANVDHPYELPADFASNKFVRSKVVKYLDFFDDHVRGFRFERQPRDSGNEGVRDISTLHQNFDSPGMTELPLSEESAGTRVMFSLFPHIQHVLQKGSVLFVDDLTAHMHPLLLRYILRLFLDPEINKKHAQLVFTTHEIWLLAIHLLRQDEIKFVEKDADGVSTLYSAADITEGQDVDMLEKYLTGEFGVIQEFKETGWARYLSVRK